MTFSELYRQVLAEMPGLPIQIVKAYLNRAYYQIAHAWEWSTLEQDFRFNTFTSLTGGTVAVTNGSTTVTGTDTSFTGGFTATSLYYFKVDGDDQYYKISATGLGDDETLTLTEAYGGTTNTEADYEVFKHVYELDLSVRELLSMQFQSSLQERDALWIEKRDPSRESTGDPQVFIKRGTTSAGTALVELCPRPTTMCTVGYRARINATTMSSDSEVPRVDADLLFYTALLNLIPVYTRRLGVHNPAAAGGLNLSAKVWAERRGELHAQLVHEDLTRHSLSRKVKRQDINSSSGERVYFGDDFGQATIDDYS